MRHAAAPSLKEGGNLTSYLAHAHRYPSLEAEEEYNLVKKWQDAQDPAALDRLIKSHLKLVAKIAVGYRGYGLPLHDLVAEGSLGVLQAVKRFNADKGFRFSTYAMWWIRAAIQEYVLSSWSMVRIATTNNQRKLFYKLKQLKEKMGDLSKGALENEQIQHIATTLDVSPEEVKHMDQRLGGGDQSLNASVGEEGLEWQEWLVDESQDQESALIHQDELDKRQLLLEKALGCLNQREYEIFTARRLRDDPLTLETLAQQLHLSRERVRQIEAKAFEKLQKAMKSIAYKERLGVGTLLFWLGTFEIWQTYEGTV